MRAAFFLFALMLLAAAAPAMAQRAQGVMPLDRILPEIRRTHPGQFYDADGPSPAPDGSPHYHLKWMTPDGRIEWLDTDARTGRVLDSAPGRDRFDSAGQGRSYPPAPSDPMPPPPPDYRGRFRGDGGGARFGGEERFQGGGFSRGGGGEYYGGGRFDRGAQGGERGRWRGR